MPLKRTRFVVVGVGVAVYFHNRQMDPPSHSPASQRVSSPCMWTLPAYSTNKFVFRLVCPLYRLLKENNELIHANSIL